jgi:hypothetical protein
MTKVNANDRATLEGAYPADIFASDAARNEQVSAALRYGVRIGSAPDAAGWFELERTARHTGEPETAHFLAPTQASGHGQFLDDIVAAAHRFGYRANESPGQGDPRIKGLRQ